MSAADLVAISKLADECKAGLGFELALPNAMLGKTVFLSLPQDDQWSYEMDARSLRSERNLILLNRMWVTRGRARFWAVHADGTRADVSVKIRPWKAKPWNVTRGAVAASPKSAGSKADQTASHKAADQRRMQTSVLRRLQSRLRKRPEQRLVIRCRKTERQIRITVRLSGSRGHLLADFLASVLCH